MKDAQSRRPYTVAECFLAAFLLLFAFDVVVLIHFFSGSRLWLQTTWEFFEVVELKFVTSVFEALILGFALVIIHKLITRIFNSKPANLAVNISIFAFIMIFYHNVIGQAFLNFLELLGISREGSLDYYIYLGVKYTILAAFIVSLIVKKSRTRVINFLSRNFITERLKPLAVLCSLFLVVGALAPLALNSDSNIDVKTVEDVADKPPAANLPDIYFIVYDTLSSRHTPFGRYHRKTMPHLQEFIDDGSTAYLNHYTSSDYSGPSTASLLTGKHVLHHRVFQNGGTIFPEHRKENIFSLLKKRGYTTIAYTHNHMADAVIRAFIDDVDITVPFHQLHLERDYCTRIASYLKFAKAGRFCRERNFGFVGGNFLNDLWVLLFGFSSPVQQEYIEPIHYRNEDAHEWLYNNLEKIKGPKFVYLHLFPPHGPYHHRTKFSGIFDGSQTIPDEHPTEVDIKNIDETRLPLEEDMMRYDVHIYDTDDKFNDFIAELDRRGLLDNSLFILTSDHGEQFSDHFRGHGNYLYEEQIHVPLVIKFPHQREKKTYTALTSMNDIPASIISFAGLDVPDWVDGTILPGFPHHSETTPSRPFFSVYASEGCDPRKPVTHATISMLEYPYKLIWYMHEDKKELYNLDTDPRERTNIMNAAPEKTRELLGKLKEHVATFDAPYSKK